MTDRPYCSRAAAPEPMPGSAPVESHWLFVEAPGSWGRDALAGSSLSPQQREALASLPAHWRVVMVRRPDRPLRRQTDRMVWSSTPESVRCWRLPASAPLHPADLGSGDPVADEVLFLCTNGARDRCCAVFGRRLLDAAEDPRVWECSHLGGHRFAPTGVRLADRTVFGRLDLAAAREILAGATPLDHVRGPAGWPPQVQAAAVAVWRHHRAVALASAVTRTQEAVIALADGTEWLVPLREAAGERRPLSCGAPWTAADTWAAGTPAPAPG